MPKSLARLALKAFGRTYPLYSGCGTITNSSPFVRATEGIEVPVLTSLRDGTPILVNPQEFLGRSIYFSGEWDPKITWVLRRLLRAGDTVVDIGAHCGATALAAARIVGPSGMVHAFEPQPALARMLRDSASLNAFSHLHVHEYALSDSDGSAELYLPHDKPILASLEKVSGASSFVIQKRRAGDVLEGLDLPVISLVKIDVEGHELEVFEGAAAFLEKRKPRAILFESVEKEGPFHQRPAVQFLASLDYSFFGLPKRLVTMKARAVHEAEPAGCHDFVAVQRSDLAVQQLLSS